MRPITTKWQFWAVNASFWCVLALSNGLSGLTDLGRRGITVDVAAHFRGYLIGFSPWILFTALVFTLVHWQPITRERWLLPLAIYCAVVALGATLYIPFDAALTLWMGGQPISRWREAIGLIPTHIYFLEGLLAVSLFTFANVEAAYRGARERADRLAAVALDNARLERELADARLQMLRAQLEPHFLFNALNAVTALVRSGESQAAVEAVARLSDLLRYATEVAAREAASVAEEVEFGEQYLRFQQLRFGPRLRSEVDVDDAVEQLEVLPMLVQPLLENAIRHGVERSEGASLVKLAVRAHGNRLVFRVENSPRPALEPSAAGNGGLGVGLLNSRRRLQARYGADFALTTGPEGDAWVSRLEIPIAGPWDPDLER